MSVRVSPRASRGRIITTGASTGARESTQARRSAVTFMPRNDPCDTAATERGDRAAGVSVVMVTYWTGPVLTAVIESVLSADQEGVVELVLVDNGNPPEVAAQLAGWAADDPRLVVINGHGNVGYARGCNLGTRRARGRHLLLLNPDCRLTPGALPALLAEAASLGERWMLGCRVLNPDGSDQRGSRRALLTPLTALVETFRLDRLVPKLLRRHRLNHHEDPLPEDTVRIPVVNGACMMLPAATLQAVGGMDEGYFLHVDDLDLCLRLHRNGTPVYFAPHVEAVHHAGSSRTGAIRIEWHKARGFLRYFGTHYRGLRWMPLKALLYAGILIRFGIKVIRCLLRSAWRRIAPRAPQAPSGAGEHAPVEGRGSETEAAFRS